MYYKLYLLISGLILCFSYNAYSQLSEANFSDEWADSVGMFKLINTRHENYLDILNRKEKKRYEEAFNKLLNYQKSLFREGQILRSPEIEMLFAEASNLIQKSNPKIDISHVRFYLSDDMSINAYAIGNDMIVVNAGLIRMYQDPCALIYILCHEIAHLMRRHAYIKIKTHYDAIHDEKKYKELEDSEAGYDEITKEIASISKNLKTHSREFETEADSLGYGFYSNIGLSKDCASNAINKLSHKNYDCNDSIPFYSTLNFLDTLLKPEWVRTSDNITMKKIDFLDTTSTHPAQETRLKFIARQSAMVQDVDMKTYEVAYHSVRSKIGDEIIHQSIKDKRYGRATFILMNDTMINQKQRDLIFASILSKIYKDRKENNQTDMISPKAELCREMNTLLTFFYNIPTADLKTLLKEYLEHLKPLYSETPSYYLTYSEYFDAIGHKPLRDKYLNIYNSKIE